MYLYAVGPRVPGDLGRTARRLCGGHSLGVARLAAVLFVAGVFVWCVKVYDPMGTVKAGWTDRLP